jgi:hypothetical protein
MSFRAFRETLGSGEAGHDLIPSPSILPFKSLNSIQLKLKEQGQLIVLYSFQTFLNSFSEVLVSTPTLSVLPAC